MRYTFEEEFRLDHPETVGETDRHFDLDNYKDWLEAQLIEARKQLHQCNVRCQLAISALQAIDNPIAYIESNMEEGYKLNGMAVIMITEKPIFYQNIAKEALNKIANCT